MQQRPGLVKGNPPPPPSMKAVASKDSIIGKELKEVPLPSQEGTKGVVQYALCVKAVLSGIIDDG